jgi:hypothetical protein
MIMTTRRTIFIRGSLQANCFRELEIKVVRDMTVEKAALIWP